MGGSNDAIAYLQAVHARKLGFEMLRRIETDRVLDVVRARPELVALVTQIAGDLLVSGWSSFGSSDAQPHLPGSSVSGCTTLELARDSKYHFSCGGGF